MKKNLVSIVVPVHNAEKTIRRCVESLINQSVSESVEIICVNDGSSDNSLHILEEIAAKNNNLVVLNQENSGPGKARNYALSVANGEFIMFCDADDSFEPSMVEEMRNAIVEHNVDLCMCDTNVHYYKKYSEAKKKIYNELYFKIKYKGFKEFDSLLARDINAVLWNKIFRRSIIDEYGIVYPEKYEHDDMSFLYKYFLVSKTYFGLDKKLYNYTIGNPKSIMGLYHNRKVTPHMYDFIFAMSDMYNFLARFDANDKTATLIKRFFCLLNGYYYKLPRSAMNKAEIYIKDLINENSELFKRNGSKFVLDKKRSIIQKLILILRTCI